PSSRPRWREVPRRRSARGSRQARRPRARTSAPPSATGRGRPFRKAFPAVRWASFLRSFGRRSLPLLGGKTALRLAALPLRCPGRARRVARGRPVGAALQFLAKPRQRGPQVLRARPLVFSLGGDAARPVDEADRRLGLVPVLSARAAR